MKRSLLQVSLLVLLILTNGLAQTDRGTIRGTVEDSSGAAVAGAEVRLKHRNRHTDTTQSTESEL